MIIQFNNIQSKKNSCFLNCMSLNLPTHVFYLRLLHSRHHIELNKYPYLESNGLRPYSHRVYDCIRLYIALYIDYRYKECKTAVAV